jgi:cell division transport system permease protein
MMLLYLKRAIKDVRQNSFLNLVTIITIALSIMIVSAFALFFINTNDLVNAWKKGVRIMVYLNGDTAATEVPNLQRMLGRLYGVSAARFISKDEALKNLKNQLSHQASLLDNLKQNPLPDAFEIRLTPKFQNWQKVEKLALQIQNMPEIDDVEFGQAWLGRFTYIFDLFRLAGYALGALFFMAAVFFVANTIRLVLYSRREEVEIMRLVGAEDRFIKTPFYIEGVIQGALGGIVGLVACLVLFLVVSSNVKPALSAGIFQVRFLPPKMILAMVMASMLVGWIGSFVSLKQFFR